MNRRWISAILIAGMISTFVGCAPNSNEKAWDKSSVVEKSEENKGEEKKEKNKSLTGIEKTKYDIREMMPGLIEDIETLMIDNSTKIQSEIDLSEIQILLVSNLIKTAYLINNQNEEFGESHEVIEYSTDTIKDTNVLTGGFGSREFNGKETYVFNVDTLAMYDMQGGDLRKTVFDTLLHEGIHIFYHQKMFKNVETAEKGKGGLRTQEYPVLAEERIVRAQTLNYLNKALLSESQEEKIENIRKANYFYKKYLELDDKNKYATKYDMIEGQAKYFEFRGNTILNNPLASNKEIVEATTELYINTYEGLEEGFLTNMSKELEYYAIGSAALTLIYDMENGEDIGMVNPLQYLLDKFGYIENEGDGEITQEIRGKIDGNNAELKKIIDEVEARAESDEYVHVRIPAMRDNSKIGSMTLKMLPIKYDFNGKEGTVNKMLAEIEVYGNRLKFNDALTVWREFKDQEGRRLGTHYEIFIPREDVEIDGDRITVQSEELQLFNMKFEEKDGMYTISE